jgi:hypothetical protein
MLLDSEGTAVAFGANAKGQCDVPALPAGLTYRLPTVILQASADGNSVRFVSLVGEQLCQIDAVPTDRLADIYGQLMARLAGRFAQVAVVLSGGRVLSGIPEEEETAACLFGHAPRG